MKRKPSLSSLKRKLVLDTGKGCSVCGQVPVVNVEGAYWLCGECVFESLKELMELRKIIYDERSTWNEEEETP